MCVVAMVPPRRAPDAARPRPSPPHRDIDCWYDAPSSLPPASTDIDCWYDAAIFSADPSAEPRPMDQLYAAFPEVGGSSQRLGGAVKVWGCGQTLGDRVDVCLGNGVPVKLVRAGVLCVCGQGGRASPASCASVSKAASACLLPDGSCPGAPCHCPPPPPPPARGCPGGDRHAAGRARGLAAAAAADPGGL